MRTFNINVSKYFSEKTKLGDVLVKATAFDLTVLADAASKGALWQQKLGKGKILKVRGLQHLVNPADKLTLYYDPRILSFPPLAEAKCLYEATQYGIWHKAAGVLPQGTQSGDHTSLLRFVEKHKNKECYLVHRLDRETEGLMIIGYTSEGAAKLSDLFQKNRITKTYQAVVKGELERGLTQTINHSLDGKEAITHFEVLRNAQGMSHLNLQIDTGRLHQIRRHLEAIDHPVMGDPKYGRGNKNRDGLQLLAKSLSFVDPWTGVQVTVTLEQNLILPA